MSFLVTTAIERFWDKKKNILFLQEGCCRFSKRNSLEGLNYKIIPRIWSDVDKIEEAHSRITITYEKVLDDVVIILNKLHHVNYSERYWRIVVGRWLHQYIFVLYERYYSILHAAQIDPQFESISLEKDCFIIPKDLKDFAQNVKDDFYNLQLYSQIFTFMDKEFPSKKLVCQQKLEANHDQNISNNFQEHKPRIKTDYFLMHRSYFSSYVEAMIINKCEFPIETYYDNTIELPSFPIWNEIRGNLKLSFKAENDFEQLISNYIFHDMPLAYMEGYQYVKELSYTKVPYYQTMPRAILSAVSFDSDEVFKQWAADCAENGTELIGVSHSIAPTVWIPFEEIMEKICDRFYAPGYIAGRGANVTIMPVTKFCARIECNNKENPSTDILYLSNCLPRYFDYGFNPDISTHVEEYFLNQKIFFDNVNETYKNKLRIRVYIHDWGQNCVERWKAISSDIVLEGMEVPLTTRIHNCKIAIVDNHSTTFAEVMLYNKPVIIVWDYKKWLQHIHIEAEKDLEALKAVGILHDNPISAAQMLNKVYGDVDSWWDDPALQEVRKKICKAYTGYSESSPANVMDWIDELNRLYAPQNEIVKDLDDYLKPLKNKKIAFLGANEVTQYLIPEFYQSEIVGIIDSDESKLGKYLCDVSINSLTTVIAYKPDIIIIAYLREAKQIEKQLADYIPASIKISNLARDLPAHVFRKLVTAVYGEISG